MCVLKKCLVFFLIATIYTPAHSISCLKIFKKKTPNHLTQQTPAKNHNLEHMIQTTGRRILKAIQGIPMFSSQKFQSKIMEIAMKDDVFREKILHFIYVLPALKTDQEVVNRWKEYFEDNKSGLSSFSSLGVHLASSVSQKQTAQMIKKSIEAVSFLFIGGKDIPSIQPVLEKARKNNHTFSFDLLGEAVLSEKEAKEFSDNYVHALNTLVDLSKTWDTNPQIDRDSKGRPIPSVNLSLKLSSLSPQMKEESWQSTVEDLKNRLRPILRIAKDNFVSILIDMEKYEHKNLTQEVFKSILMEKEFRNYPHFGIVLQAYLKDSLKDAKDLVEFAKQRGTPFNIRLVKGAYWDQENITALQKGWDIPVFEKKYQTDLNYEIITRRLLESGYPHIRLAVASHNVRSLSVAISLAETLNIPKQDMEIQMLYGMGNPIKKVLIEEGWRLREYIPVGKILPGMSYLVRRLLENTANNSFVRFLSLNSNPEDLLKDPRDLANMETDKSKTLKANSQFQNEAPLDWTKKENRERMIWALKNLKEDLGKSYPLVINGQEFKTDNFLKSFNPSDHTLIGSVTQAGVKEADLAVATAQKAFTSWSATPVQERIKKMQLLAEEILKRRFELMALEVLEVGKTWSEADGDIIEAIDFIRYYSHQMQQLSKTQSMSPHLPGESNLYEYRPKGVVVAIAPWNFPLAILTGMTVGPLVAGNTVVVKPAEQSPVIALKLMEMMDAVGFPKGVVNFVPGLGEEVGERLVQHKDVSVVNFTGSKDVGLGIVKKIAEPQGDKIKKAVVELGGKNSIIIDNDADLDHAIEGVIHSAFGFQGQKCSACSRVIVLSGIYDEFLNRFAEAVQKLKVIPPENPESDLGPVIDQEAFARLQNIINDPQLQKHIVHKGTVDTKYSKGLFIPPLVLKDLDQDSPVVRDEMFGPVLAIIKAKDLDQALAIANNSLYGLTGGIYSRSPSHIKKVKEELRVGNLYINRSITGSIVGRQAFGGLKLSGSGGKAGGPDYLLNFLDAVSISDADIIPLIKND